MARIYRSLDEVPADFGPCALTIGNFDGVHAGHRAIVRRVCAVAAANGWKASALTFEPHPTRIVAPSRTPRLMTTPEDRCRLMALEGIQQVLILPFDESVAHLSPEEFAARIVAGRLGAKAVLVGRNFRFGHRQAGDVRALEALGSRFGFTTEVVPAVAVHGRLVSSSGIRSEVEAGRMAAARHMLGRPYSLQDAVIPGHGVGSKQTVPTLNLAVTAEVLPASGVYVTRTSDLESDRVWPSVTNVGYRPTFGGDTLGVETYLLERLQGERPVRIRVEFLRRLRDERKFASAEELKTQILRDAVRASTYFRRLRKCHN